jgi:CheY-like chemotaxis protein
MSDTERRILLVEDNPDDVFHMERLFRKEKIVGQMDVAADGRAAIAYLQKELETEPTPHLSLVFLDLKLPFLNGFDVLAWMRHQPKLEKLPVAILTSSVEESDREKAAFFGVPFLVKPPTPQMIRNAIFSGQSP